jgi:hypothetical protein
VLVLAVALLEWGLLALWAGWGDSELIYLLPYFLGCLMVDLSTTTVLTHAFCGGLPEKRARGN